MKTTLFIVFGLLISTSTVFADGKKGSSKKVQEVNFSEMSLKGTVRNPEGAFLVQKKGIKFLPLIEVNQDMDSRIRNSTQYVK